MLLHYLGQDHLEAAGLYLICMETACIDTVMLEMTMSQEIVTWFVQSTPTCWEDCLRTVRLSSPPRYSKTAVKNSPHAAVRALAACTRRLCTSRWTASKLLIMRS